jgi:non-heme chloroperoxidase
MIEVTASTAPHWRPNSICTADGVDLFYRDWGAGRPLLFLSGWTLNSLMWGYQMEPLAKEGFRCIAYDRRAHGRSSDPGGGYDFDTLADDLAAVVAALDLQDVIGVAHSFSSGEIVRYLTRHGDGRIAGVIMLAPAAIPFLMKTEDNPLGLSIEAMQAVGSDLAEDFPGWAERHSAPYFAGWGSRGIIDATLAMMNQTSHQAMLALAEIQGTTDFRSELARIDIPVLFIHGDRDASAPIELTSKPACDLVKSARLIVYEGGPHGLYFTHKADLNRDIVRFASSLETKP